MVLDWLPVPVVAIVVTALLGLLGWLRHGNAERRKAADAAADRQEAAQRQQEQRAAERIASKGRAEARACDFYVFADFDYGPVRMRFTKKAGDEPVVDARVVARDTVTGRSYGPFACDSRVLRGVAAGSALWPADQNLGSSPDHWRTLEGFAYWVSDGHVFRSPLRVYPLAEQGRLFDTDLRARECLGALGDGEELPV